MPFLQAVFCLKGFDDRSRYFATSLFALIGFIFCSAIFSAYPIFSFAILALLSTVLAFSTKRRLRDAKLNKNWQLVPAALLLLTGGLSLIIGTSSSYYLLILPALSATLLLTYPSRNNQVNANYIFGYYGPVDLAIYHQKSTPLKSHSQRIEPTLAAEGANEHAYVQESSPELVSDSVPYTTNSKQVDIGELIRLKFLNNRKLQLAVIASVSLIFIAVFISSAINSLTQSLPDVKEAETQQTTKIQNQASNIFSNKGQLLAMPDNFNLYLSTFQGIIIHWQADQVESGELWSQATATGDESCQAIKFNKGSSLRPLNVLVENGSDYFASFSPMDSNELVRALAFRGKFSLCGYSFSLKGSQAALGKNNNYAHYLDKSA